MENNDEVTFIETELRRMMAQWRRIEQISQEVLQMADIELLAIQRIMKNLQQLTPEEKIRVVKYVYNRTISEEQPASQGDKTND